MDSWRSIILQDFTPNLAELTLVADQDALLSEEKLASELRRRGFELVIFNDPVELRFIYEVQYRSLEDQGQRTNLVIILPQGDAQWRNVPYDLLQKGRKLSFHLGNLFPNISYPVLVQLDRALLDAVFDAQKKSPPDRMGERVSKDYILRHVFGVAPELLFTEKDLLLFLLRLHYGNVYLPSLLAEHLVEVLQQNGNLCSWNHKEMLSDAKCFFAFLQEHWPVFIEAYHNNESVQALPFDHPDIRIYVEKLFIEGKLTPIHAPHMEVPHDAWILSGVDTSQKGMKDQRITGLFEHIENANISLESRHTDWISFAMMWAELSALIHTTHEDRHKARFDVSSEKLHKLFSQWLEYHYASLIHLPPTQPAMVHHISRYLARQREEGTSAKIALLVIDGLSLDQWVSIRHVLQRQTREMTFRESATFAWIPTITSVSRQALFAGKPPIYFPKSIHSTHNEERLWQQFWQEHNISKLNVAYKRGFEDAYAETVLEDVVRPATTKIVGLVIDTVDKIMHGMQLGAAGMHNQIIQWCERGSLASVLKYFLRNDYNVWLTSDHGNIESVGAGKLSEGACADMRGERARIYSTPALRSGISSQYTFAREWHPYGLPNNYFPLIAHGNTAFIQDGMSTVTHGGTTIEEVLVPFVKIEMRGNNE